jgi:pyrroline-5-carboxylate reductase
MKRQNKKYNIGIFGYGNMGKAIFELLQKHSSLKKKANFLIHSLGVNKVKNAIVVKSLDELSEAADIIFLCVKPQDFYRLGPLEPKPAKKVILISIMAGVPIARIKNVFSNGRIIRTMPNLPLQVGEGLVGWSTNKRQFSEAELRLVEEIFSAFGQSIYVNNEKKLDAITAVSASGPAYVFLFIDALVKAAEKLGFDKKQSETLVLKTITGSVSYLQAQDKKDLEQLIKKVASKGGITEVALKELKIDNFYKQWQKAIAKAHQRARQLSSYEPK